MTTTSYESPPMFCMNAVTSIPNSAEPQPIKGNDTKEQISEIDILLFPSLCQFFFVRTGKLL